MQNECKDCRYFDKQFRDESGLCRVNPPSMITVVTQSGLKLFHGRWPEVKVKDWCGRFTAAEPPAENGAAMEQMAEIAGTDSGAGPEASAIAAITAPLHKTTN